MWLLVQTIHMQAVSLPLRVVRPTFPAAPRARRAQLPLVRHAPRRAPLRPLAATSGPGDWVPVATSDEDGLKGAVKR